MSEIRILGLPPSTYVRTTLMTAEAKGVAATLQPVDFRSSEYLSDHPFGRIPVLRHGDVHLYETLAVTTYLDEAFEGPALQPKKALDRARMLQWISVINDYVYAGMVRGCIAERFVKPMRGLTPDETAIRAAMPDIVTQLAVFDKTLNGQAYLCGAELTLADLFLVPIMHYFAATPEGRQLLPDHENIRAWLNTMSTSPGFESINSIAP